MWRNEEILCSNFVVGREAGFLFFSEHSVFGQWIYVLVLKQGQGEVEEYHLYHLVPIGALATLTAFNF